jgi:anti-sigma regulatory factor (Ser/Thr protein kinase)/PAS domain-containing protein
MRLKYIRRDNLPIITGILLLLLLIVMSGITGFYTIYKAHIDTEEYFEAVDMAREAQVLILKQFHTWKRIVIEGDDPEIYRREFHAFSKYSVTIQDSLFNLKTICTDFNMLTESIRQVREKHLEISQEYIKLLVFLKSASHADRNEIISRAKDRDEQLLKKVDLAVADIKRISAYRINRVNNNHLNVLLFTILVLFIIAAISSFSMARGIIRERLHMLRNIRRQSADLAEADKKIRFSEEKYRRIVEGSREMFFSLDNNWNIVNISQASREFFHTKPQNLHGKNFIDLISVGENGGELTLQLIKSKLEAFSRERNPVQFKVDLNMQHPHFSGVKTTVIRLEYIEIGDRQEIFGMAIPAEEGGIHRLIVRERLTITLSNSLILAEEITFRLTNMIQRYMKQQRVALLRIALREIIVNAIEHGNLNISFKEKTEAMLADEYFKLIQERQTDERYRDRRVTVDYSFDSQKVAYRITDDGDGFDHVTVIGMSINDINNNMLHHGRGIMMTREIFDRVEYNKKGNQVLLVANFTPPQNQNTSNI